MLYDTGPTVDMSQFQFDKKFKTRDLPQNVAPGSLLDSFLKQDETAYANTSSSPLPVDEVFANSRALLSVPSETWPGNGAASAAGVVKGEAQQSMMAAIDSLQNGELCSALQNLDAEDSEVAQWEKALSRWSQSEDHWSGVASLLESIFAGDIFDCVDGILFKGTGENPSGTPHPGCFGHQQEPAAGPCEPPLFPTPSPESTFSPHAQQQGTLCASAHTNHTWNLSHLPAGVEAVPPQLAVPEASATFQSCSQRRVGRPLSHKPKQILLHPQTGLQSDGELLQSAAEQQLADVFSPLVSCTHFKPSGRNVPVSFPSECLKNGPPPQTCDRQVQEWQQSQHQVPLAGMVQNGREQMPVCHSLMSERSGLWQNNVPKLNPGQQRGLARGRAATRSSCMFEQHFSCGPAGGDVTALSGCSGLRWADVSMDQSPPQGSCYFQWSRSEPVVGSSAVIQEDVSISPPSRPSTTASAEHTFNFQPYLDCHRQILASHCGTAKRLHKEY